MAIYELEPRVLFDGAVAAQTAEAVIAEMNLADTSDSGTTNNDSSQQPETDSGLLTNSNNTQAYIDGITDSYNEVTDGVDLLAIPGNEELLLVNYELNSISNIEHSTANDELRTTSQEIAFIDSALKDSQKIADSLGDNIKIVYLNDTESGVEQISQYLSAHDSVEAIHIVSEGNYRQIMLGDDVITEENIENYKEALTSWQGHLTQDADILFYGCDIAKDETGQGVLGKISDWTGTDIASSTNSTGSFGETALPSTDNYQLSTSSSDWTLEFSIGTIETAPIVIADYSYNLETYTVTQINDYGIETMTGTLSWAINLSNTSTDVDDTIAFDLESGSTVTLNSALPTITDTVAIDGNDGGADITVTVANQATSAFRVFKIDSSGQTVTIENMTIKGGDISGLFGNSSWGGGIYNASGILNLTGVTVTGSKSVYGGGIYNDSGKTVNITSSTISNNTATSDGGGIQNFGTLTVTNSEISSNTGNNAGGGIYNWGTLTVNSNSIISSNISSYGGGIYNQSGYTTTISDSTIDSNSAVQGGGINSVGTLNISSSTISSNSTTLNPPYGSLGGGILASGETNVTNCTFTNNSSMETSGAIEVGNYSYFYGTNTFSGNSSASGGSAININSIYGQLYLNDSTAKFAENTAISVAYGAIYAGTSTVTYNGTTQTVDDLTYNNLTLTGGGTKTLAGAIDVNGNLTIDPLTALDVSASDYQIDVGGNWTNNGAFTAQDGTVVFDGADPSVISGDTTFNNFTCTTPGKTLTFASGIVNLQAVSGTFTLGGSAASHIIVNSNNPGTKANINVTTPNVSFVTVQDSNNTGTFINPTDSTDGGNTNGWFISSAYYYRTNATGDWNWSTASNWQISANGSTGWATASEAPNASNSLGITILSGTNVAVNSNITIDQTDVNDGGSITVNDGYTLTVTDGTGTDLTVEGSGYIDVNGVIDAFGATITYSGTGILEITGTALSLGSFTAGSSTVIYNGADQAIDNQNYFFLELAGAGTTKTFADGVTKVESYISLSETMTLTGSSSDAVTVQVTRPYAEYQDGTATNSRVFFVELGILDEIIIENMTIKGGDISSRGIYDSDGLGGGIYVNDLAADRSSLLLSNLVITGAKAYSGGGLYNEGAGWNTGDFSITLEYSTVSDNTALIEGGGIWCGGASITPFTINSSTINGNSAGLQGGGIYSCGDFVLLNSTIANNFATYGGGISIGGDYSSISQIINTTISGNSASENGGGIDYFQADSYLLNSLVQNNTLTEAGGYGSDIYIRNTDVYAYSTWYSTDYDKVYGVINTQALAPNNANAYTSGDLDPLADNGGPTQTMALSDTAPVEIGIFAYYNEFAGYYFVDTEGTAHILTDWAVTTQAEPANKITVDQRGVERTDSANSQGAYNRINDFYYRTNASGSWDWSTAANWQVSADGETGWTGAFVAPDVNNSYGITIRDGANVIVNASRTIALTTIDTGGEVTIADRVTLTIEDQVGDDLTIDGTLTIDGALANNGDGIVFNRSGAIDINNNNSLGTGTLINFGTIYASASAVTLPAITLGGTVVYDGSSGQAIDTTETRYTTLQISTAGTAAATGDLRANSLTVDSGKTLDSENLYVSNGGFTNNGITRASGIVSIPTLAVGGTFIYDGADQTVVNASFNKLELAGSGTVTIITGAEVDNTFTISGTVSALSSSGTFTLNGIADFGSTVTSIGGTVRYYGTEQTIDNLTYSNLYFYSETAAAKNLGGNIDVNGNLSIVGNLTELDVTASNYQINIEGDWYNEGSFNARSGTVIFDGSGTSVIYESTTFNNFTCTTPGKTLTFDLIQNPDAVQTVLGTFMLTGILEDHITVNTNIPGTQAQINISTPNVSFVTVRDSKNSGALINPANSTNGGNNIGWFPYYRTNAVGVWNWSDASKWQISADGISSWTDAIVSPDADNSEGITILNGADVQVDTSITIDETTVNEGGAITITNGNILTVAYVDGSDLAVNGALANNGTIVNTGGIYLNTNNFSGSGTLNNDEGTIYILASNINLPDVTIGGTVHYDALSNQTVDTTGTSYAEILISTDGTATASGTLNADNLSIYESSILDSENILIVNGVGNAGTLKISGTADFGYSGPVGGIVIYDGADQTVDDISYSTLNLIGSGSVTITNGIDVNTAFTVGGTVSALTNSGTLTLSGTADFGVNIASIGGTVVYDGANQTVDNIIYSTLNITGSGTVTITNGTDVNTAFTVGGTVTITNNGALTLSGTADFGSTVLSIGGTVVYDKSGGAQTIDNITYNNISLSGGGTKTLSGAVEVNGNLSIGANTTLDVSASNYQINTAGNWTNSGSFNARNGTVVFDGSGVSLISGANNFYNFSCSSAGKTLTFAAGAGNLQTVQGIFTIAGGATDHVVINSNTPGAQATIYVTNFSVNRVTVKDSNNISPTDIVAYYDTDNGNNSGWIFTPSDFYRTNAAGLWNWSIASNWQVSTDEGYSWTTASVAPNAGNSFSITVRDGADVQVNSSISIDQAVVQSGGKITVVDGQTLTVSDGIGTDLTVQGTGYIDVNGTLDASGASVTYSGAGTLEITGAVTSLGTFTAGTSTVTYNGMDQTVDDQAYYLLALTGEGSTKTFADGTTKVNQQISIYENMTLTGSSVDAVTVQVTNPGITNARVFYVSLSKDGVCNISNMTIKGGGLQNGNGGAIYVDSHYNINPTLNLDSVEIASGSAYRGGGIYVYIDGNLNLSNSIISGNSSEHAGGGIFGHWYSNITITNSTISNNSSDDYYGSGIYAERSNVTIDNSLISNNIGNAVDIEPDDDNNGSTLTIIDTTINGNGSGINLYRTTAYIDNTTISNNESGIDVGGGSTLYLSNSTVADNHNQYPFGIIYGGIGNSGALYLMNSTISGNSAIGAAGSAGGILNYGDIYMLNSIVINNGQTDISNRQANSDIYSYYSWYDPAKLVVAFGRFNTQASAPNVNTPYSDGNLQPLADNGGYTQTMATGVGSPAADSGKYVYYNSSDGYYFVDNNGVSHEIEAWNSHPEISSGERILVDQRGNVRGETTSIGAYDPNTSYHFRTRADGNWTSNNVWQIKGLGLNDPWINTALSPTSINAASVTIFNSIAVNTDVAVINTAVEDNAALTVNAGRTFTINNTPGTDLDVQGTLNVLGNFTVTGASEIDISGTAQSLGTFTAGNSTVIYSGGNQTVDDQTYNILQLTGSGTTKMFADGITKVASDIVINEEMTLTGSSKDNVTVQVLRPGIDGNGTDSRVFYIELTSPQDTTVNISNMTIKGGNIEDRVWSEAKGGAIYVESCFLNLDSVNITSSIAQSGGGVYAGSDSTVAITDSLISNNRVSATGGGIYSIGDGVTIIGSTINDNSSNGYAGGIFAQSNFAISNSTVSNNDADGGGGGIDIVATNNANITISSVTISNNSASNYGGGIYFHKVFGSDEVPLMRIENSTINNNYVFDYGAGINATGFSDDYGTIIPVAVEMINCTISDNTSVREGTAFYGRYAALMAVDSTISNNQAAEIHGALPQSGGIALVQASQAYLLNSILINNSDIDAYISGFAEMYAYYSWYDPAKISGTILTQGVAPNVTTAYSAGDLGSLADNGGPTETMAVASGAPPVSSGTYAYYSNESGVYYFADNIGITHDLTDWSIHTAIVSSDKITDDQRGELRSTPPAIGAYNPVSYYYRTTGTGDLIWSIASNWEQSSDGVTWEAADISPDSENSLGITVRNGANVLVGEGLSIDQTVVNAGGRITVNDGYTLTVANGTGTDLTVEGTGEIDIDGIIDASGAAIAYSGAGRLEITGSAASLGAFTSSNTSIVRYNGADQTIAAVNYNILQISGANSTKTFADGITKINSEIVISEDMNITGSSMNSVTVQVTNPGVTASRVFKIAVPVHGTVDISNMTIKGGDISAFEGGVNGYGGSIYVSGYSYASLTLDSVTIEGSIAANGGGIYLRGSNTLTISNSIITGNQSTDDSEDVTGGGGIAVEGLCNLTITNSVISNNIANHNSGGGIYAAGSVVSITDSFINGNSSYYGGGIYATNWGASSESSLSISNTSISNNEAEVYGGGIYIGHGTAYINNSTISSNSSAFDGGGIYCKSYMAIDPTTVYIDNTTIADNQSVWDGAGIYNAIYTKLSVANITVSANSAGAGYTGGILNRGTSYVLNSIVINNGTTDIENFEGREFYLYYSWYNSAKVTGTISTQATAPNINIPYAKGDLLPLADNGGDTQTMAVNSGTPPINNGAYVYYNSTDGYYFVDSNAKSHKLNDWNSHPAVSSDDKITQDQRGNTRSNISTIGSYDPRVSYIYKTRADGNWSGANVWQRKLFGTQDPWVNTVIVPNYLNAESITVNHLLAVSSSLTIDQTTIESGGSLTVSVGRTLTVNNAAGTDLDVKGTINVLGYLTALGASDITISGTVISLGTFTANQSSVTYNGGNQTIDSVDYYALIISEANTIKTFADGITKVGKQIEISDPMSLTGSDMDSVTVQVTTPGEGGTNSRLLWIELNNPESIVNISNITIKGGDISANNSQYDNKGGGIYVNSAVLNLDLVKITDSAARYGGGIYGEQYTSRPTIRISNSIISNNMAYGSNSSNGGGIQTYGALSISDSIITGNNASVYGGGIYVNNDSFEHTITNTTINGNISGGEGGGLYSQNSDVSIRNSAITENTANDIGGGLSFINSSIVKIENSTIAGNSAEIAGGLFASGNSPTIEIVNSTIAENSVNTGTGGGIYINSGTGYLLNSILINNVQSDAVITAGNSLYAYYSWYDPARVSGTIISQAAALNVTTAYTAGDLGSLQNNGGSTETMAVSSTSPVYDSGAIGYYNEASGNYYFADNTGITHSLTNWSTHPALVNAEKISTDQRGVSRPSDTSIGAYQYSARAYRTVADGNWNNPAIWEVNYGNGYESASHSPDADNSESITLRHNVAVTAILTVDQTTLNTAKTLTVNSSRTLTIANGIGTDLTVSGSGMVDVNGTINATGASIVYSASGTLEVTGTVTSLGSFTAGTSSTTYNGAGNQFVYGAAYYNFTTSGGGTKTLAGNLDVNRNLTIGSGTTLDVSASNYQINLDGNWANNGAFTAKKGTVVFDGSGAQSLSGNNTFYNLTINNSSNLSRVDARGCPQLTVKNLVITDGVFISATTYGNITIYPEGTLVLSSNIVVNGAITVQPGGTFDPGAYSVIYIPELAKLNDGTMISIVMDEYSSMPMNSSFYESGNFSVLGFTLQNAMSADPDSDSKSEIEEKYGYPVEAVANENNIDEELIIDISVATEEVDMFDELTEDYLARIVSMSIDYAVSPKVEKHYLFKNETDLYLEVVCKLNELSLKAV